MRDFSVSQNLLHCLFYFSANSRGSFSQTLTMLMTLSILCRDNENVLNSVHQTLPLRSWVHRGPYDPGSSDLVRIMWLIQAMKCELKSCASLLGDEEAPSVPSLLSLPLPILAQELKDSKMAEKHDGKSLDHWGTTWGAAENSKQIVMWVRNEHCLSLGLLPWVVLISSVSLVLG